MTNSRNKGAQFERQVATQLFQELGMTFKRDLRQYQQAEYGDLITDDEGWPFTIECKAYAKGADCLPAWEAQVFKAAAATGLHPVVIYKFNNRPIRCRVWFDAMAEAFGAQAVCGGKADVSIQDFAWLAREIMAGRADRKMIK